MGKKISVIIPMYNVEEYIEECLNSVLQQTFQKFEIICINDGSTDCSGDIAERYSKKDARIRVFHQKNAGLSAARNHGLRTAEGEYVLFLDSDDYLLEETLDHLYTEASKGNLDELFYNAKVFCDSEALEKQQSFYEHYYQRKEDYSEIQTGRSLFIKMNQKRDLKPSACLQLLKRQFLLEHQLDFYEGIIHEDNLFTMKCLAFAKRTKFLNEDLYMRRVRVESIMTKEKGFRNAYGYFVTIRELICFAGEQNLSEDQQYFEEYQKRLCLLSDVAASYVKYFQKELPECLKNLDAEEQVLFQMLIVHGHTVRERIKKNEAINYQKKIKELEESRSYRIGRKITALPRKMKELFSKGK